MLWINGIVHLQDGRPDGYTDQEASAGEIQMVSWPKYIIMDCQHLEVRSAECSPMSGVNRSHTFWSGQVASCRCSMQLPIRAETCVHVLHEKLAHEVLDAGSQATIIISVHADDLLVISLAFACPV